MRGGEKADEMNALAGHISLPFVVSKPLDKVLYSNICQIHLPFL